MSNAPYLITVTTTRADHGVVVNVSSVHGFWAHSGPTVPHTAYSAAKFAVKGFTEALITDFRVHAPHLRALVVMPGHVGTAIIQNSASILDQQPTPTAHEVRDTTLSDAFIASAPTTASDAALQILEAVDDGRWRVLIGQDAIALDCVTRWWPDLVSLSWS